MTSKHAKILNIQDKHDFFKNNDQPPTISTFRRILPQILATSAKNLILLDLGMTVAFPTLVIAALLNSKSQLSFNTSQASWFGSIAFICQPIGSIISGTVLEPLGRKRSMLLVNMPQLIGWCFYYYAFSVPILIAAAVMMGFGIGFMEAPVITYVGEISEPNIRGTLTSYSQIFVTGGLIIELTLGTLYGWNTAALISAFVPIITFIAISQVPETPIWLLSKGRIEEAERSLCWLRGWVSPSYIQDELNQLIRHCNASKFTMQNKQSTNNNVKSNNNHNPDNPTKNIRANNSGDDKPSENSETEKSNEIKSENLVINNHSIVLITNHGEIKPTKMDLIRDLTRPEIRRPLMLVIALFLFHNASGFPAIRPYMVKIFQQLRFPIDAHWCTVLISVIGFVGVITCMTTVHYFGKRFITLCSLTGCACSILTLSLWTWIYVENANGDDASICYWTPFILFTIFSFSFSFGITSIPWMILSEIFPFRGRGFASGLSAAISYIMGFVASKTFLDLEVMFGISGVFLMYGIITVIGIAYVYFKLPETEGRTLEEIELFYKSNK